MSTGAVAWDDWFDKDSIYVNVGRVTKNKTCKQTSCSNLWDLVLVVVTCNQLFSHHIICLSCGLLQNCIVPVLFKYTIVPYLQDLRVVVVILEKGCT